MGEKKKMDGVKIPISFLVEMCQYLNGKDLINISLVSKKFKRAFEYAKKLRIKKEGEKFIKKNSKSERRNEIRRYNQFIDYVYPFYLANFIVTFFISYFLREDTHYIIKYISSFTFGAYTV